ncbi:hypothetical protein MTR_5g035000 [Medicago truncatula]|uniref:Uncharacterized protein n=1 Tax=Medicago truncatula TaxID=3880 RepID=G7K2S8_MEDTR|nr:hypothetical protein MTR_5g035000 [Medicago truncatula]
MIDEAYVVIMKHNFHFHDGSSCDSLNPTNEGKECSILNSVTPLIAQTILHIYITSNACNTLKESFSLAKRASVSDLQSELLISCVSDCFTNISTIWEELEMHRSIPNCTYHVPSAFEIDLSSKAWNTLKEHFSHANCVCVLRLRCQLFNFRQNDKFVISNNWE